MAKNDNLHDFLVDIADAIREKTETTDLINPQDFSDKIRSISGGGSSDVAMWTGHADVAGLKAIGWTDEDIEYYQQHGVNWDEEDDGKHLVSEANKAMYGVINADNIADFVKELVYLPKINTKNVTDMSYMFDSCFALCAIPQIDTSNVTDMSYMFSRCYNLISIPPLDTKNVTDMSYMFDSCFALCAIPQIDTSNVTTMESMFYSCSQLTSIPMLNTSKVTTMDGMFSECHSLISIPPLDTRRVTHMRTAFSSCYSLREMPEIDTVRVVAMNSIFTNCYSLMSVPSLDLSSNTQTALFLFSNCYMLRSCRIKNLTNCVRFQFVACPQLDKESVLYLINNEKNTSTTCLIGMPSNLYDVINNDPEVITALNNHPKVALVSVL